MFCTDTIFVVLFTFQRKRFTLVSCCNAELTFVDFQSEAAKNISVNYLIMHAKEAIAMKNFELVRKICHLRDI